MLPALPMRRRLPLLAFILYVTLDLSNPFVPGAFTFNPDECVESVQFEREREARAADTSRTDLRAAAHERRVSLRMARPHVPHVLTEWLVSVRRAHGPESALPAPIDEH